VREYTELLVRCRRLLTKIEDTMLNDRDKLTAASMTRSHLIPAAVDLLCILTAPAGTSLNTPYWTPRQVDADTTSPPLGEH
jgi:hypothetical protein